jgi:hypothetical protein
MQQIVHANRARTSLVARYPIKLFVTLQGFLLKTGISLPKQYIRMSERRFQESKHPRGVFIEKDSQNDAIPSY